MHNIGMRNLQAIIDGYLDQWKFIRWADERMVLAAGTIADETEFFKDRRISAGSVHALLLHMMSAQAMWLKIWSEGDAMLPDISPEACSNLGSVRTTWPVIHDAVESFLSQLKPGDLDSSRKFTRKEKDVVLPLRDTITTMLDHCGYHRGHLNTLVKLAGGKRVWLSCWIFALSLHPQSSGVTEADFLFS